LETSTGEGLKDHPQHVDPISRARAAFASFLLGNRGEIRPYRFNLLFAPGGGSSEARLPEGLNWYLVRGADMTAVYSKSLAAAYVKLPGMLFWTSIVPPDPGGWKGTRIAKHGTIRSNKNQIVKDADVGTFLMGRADTIYKKISDLSPEQKRRIEDTTSRDSRRAVESQSFETFLQDERLRRDNRFKPRSDRTNNY